MTTLDANIVLLDLPGTIAAWTVANADLSYTIVINARLSQERQQKAYEHELKHIKNGDFNKEESSDLIELLTHE